MAVGVIAKETYRDMHASLNEVSHQITSDVALRNKSSSGAGGAKHPEGTDSHSICERAGGAKRTGLRGWQTGIGKAHGQIPEIGNSRLETGPPIGPAQTISDGLRSPRPQRPAECGPLRRSWRSLRFPGMRGWRRSLAEPVSGPE